MAPLDLQAILRTRCPQPVRNPQVLDDLCLRKQQKQIQCVMAGFLQILCLHPDGYGQHT